MSSSEPKTEKPPRPKPDPKALSSEYHKARKQLMLWAAILLIWELVGVDLAKAEAAGGNIGALITSIKSPQAIPWALFILVGYFLFKVTIEWHQCTLPRRNLRVSKIDFTSAWVVAIGAYTLYIGQRISQVQLADRLQSLSINPYSLLGGIAGFFVPFLAWSWLLLARGVLRKQRRLFITISAVLWSGILLILGLVATTPTLVPGERQALVGAFFGLGVPSTIAVVIASFVLHNNLYEQDAES